MVSPLTSTVTLLLAFLSPAVIVSGNPIGGGVPGAGTAAPAPTGAEPRPTEDGLETVRATFRGAADAHFRRDIPVDARFTSVDDPLSVSHIEASGNGHCTFYGVDGVSVSTDPAATDADVGPPQTIVAANCRPGLRVKPEKDNVRGREGR